MAATLLTLFGLLALLLSAVGIYGVLSYAVTERTREMGIRLALGATTGGVVWTLALPGIALSLAGVALGCAASLAAGRLVGHFVWGVSPRDPATFLAVAAVFLLVATAASLAPALRVLRLDPAQTLRAD
jgi:ABC-type antimicrobial peptide transport system permease subunit